MFSSKAILLAAAVVAGSVGTRPVDTIAPAYDVEAPVAWLDNSVSTVTDTNRQQITLAADVLFAFDSANISADAAIRFDAVAASFANARPTSVTIDGYTDSNGDEAYNLDLSRRRAESVQQALRTRTDATFTVTGHNEDNPVAPNDIDGKDNPDGRAKNRRVTISYATTQ